MKTHYKLLTAVFFLPVMIFANTLLPTDAITTKEKTIQKSFTVSKNATLKIDNSFGNVDIITWDKNTIEFDIIIRVSGNNDEKVENRLQNIDVEFYATNMLVSAETQIEKNKKSWWDWGSNVNLKLEINYIIKIPITNNIDINNDYGSVTVDTLEGVAKISCDYGKITTKELMADNNDISFDYSKGCYFEYIKSGKINADFSSYTVAKAKNLNINANYTNGSVEVAESVNYDCDFNALSIENVNNVHGKGDYLTLRLGNVYKNATIESDFGSIKIDRMASNAGNLTIASEYAGMTIGYDKDYSFNFEIDLEFASLKSTDNFNFDKKRVESNEKYYKGNYGATNSKNMVKISSEFGSVTFKKQ
jgi:hypothetical protein